MCLFHWLVLSKTTLHPQLGAKVPLLPQFTGERPDIAELMIREPDEKVMKAGVD